MAKSESSPMENPEKELQEVLDETVMSSEDVSANITDEIPGESPVPDAGTQTADEDIAEESSINQDTDVSMIIPEPEMAKEALTSEEYAEFQRIMQKMAFYNPHRFAAASKAQKKEMFASQHIITENGAVKVENETTKLKQDMLELAASAKAKRILTGYINGYREIESNGNIKQYLADVTYGYGTCKVLIPDYVLFHYQYEDHLNQKTQQAVQNRLRRMIGAEIRFIVKYFDQKTKTAYADRLKAMESIAWNNYIREITDDKPRVYAGLIAQGSVVAVAGNYIIVNVFGSDSKIMREECSWNYINDCREVFKVNDRVNCKVLAVKEIDAVKASKEIYHLIATTLSIKQTTENPAKKYFDNYSVNGLYRAVVTYLNEDGVFVVLDDKVPCLAAHPRYAELPAIGDMRVIKITEKTKNEETGEYRIFGVLQAQ